MVSDISSGPIRGWIRVFISGDQASLRARKDLDES